MGGTAIRSPSSVRTAAARCQSCARSRRALKRSTWSRGRIPASSAASSSLIPAACWLARWSAAARTRRPTMGQLKKLGDGIMALFGYPHAPDTRKATRRAALIAGGVSVRRHMPTYST